VPFWHTTYNVNLISLRQKPSSFAPLSRTPFQFLSPLYWGVSVPGFQGSGGSVLDVDVPGAGGLDDDIGVAGNCGVLND
jgi:hypothetical protein